MTITIVVADDQAVVRAGIAMLLRAEPDLEVVAEAADGLQAVELTRRHDPDVVVMDVRMPGMDGIEATRIVTRDPVASDRPTKVLVLTTFDDDEAVHKALRAGASGYLLKAAVPEKLVEAVRAIADGGISIDQAVAGTVLAALRAMPATTTDRAAAGLDYLTPREREVLSQMALGLSNSEIAERWTLSETTVKTHVSRVIMKTGSRDRAQAIVLAYQTGLVAPPRST